VGKCGISAESKINSTNDGKNDPKLFLKAGVRIREFVGTNSNPSKGRVTRGAAFAAEY
jgi:hypothetical protein